MSRPRFDQRILILQGGGALGAYQAGAYEGLAEAGFLPDWVVGISIGGINSALIAGNPPERRVERLRAFWDLVSSYDLTPAEWVAPVRPIHDKLSTTAVEMFGIPGFFVPRPGGTFGAGGEGLPSIYDTSPLNETLKQLVDFDLISHGKTRLSLGAVQVTTGASVYFDSRHTRIMPDHVRASGALPPGFPSVVIDGEHYWDGGIVSNSPLWYLGEDMTIQNALIVAVDLFNASGELPTNLDQVEERTTQIRYSSKTRFNTETLQKLGEMRTALERLLDNLPPKLKATPEAQKLMPLRARKCTVIRIVDSGRPYTGVGNEHEFSRATVNERWERGRNHIWGFNAIIDQMKPMELGLDLRIYDLDAKMLKREEVKATVAAD